MLKPGDSIPAFKGQALAAGFGVLAAQDVALRATVIIDPEGIIASVSTNIPERVANYFGIDAVVAFHLTRGCPPTVAA